MAIKCLNKLSHRAMTKKKGNMKKELTVGDLFADNRSPLTVIREDSGERILVHPALVEFVSADRVKILVPGKEGYGLVVPENPQVN